VADEQAAAALPHGYPFRLLDRVGGGAVEVLVAGNAAQLRGAAELPPFLAVEVMAQAALVTLASTAASDDSPSGGLLAGVESVVVHAPLRAGDRLRAHATLLVRMGALVKVRCELRRGAELVVEGGLLLALSS
jgi:predicted hotdog family 3-hydroxylacyl-ACP dehydratase